MRTSSLASVLVGVVVLAGVALGSCSRKPSGSPPAPVVLAKPTFVVSQSNLGEVQDLAPDLSSFSIPAGAPSAKALTSVGNVVLFGITDKTPYGAARKIVSTSTAGGLVTVETEPANLSDVFARAKLSVPFAIAAQSAIDVSRTNLPSGVVVRSADERLAPRMAWLPHIPQFRDPPTDSSSGSQAKKDGFYVGLNDYTLAVQSSGGTVSGKAVVNANLFLSANPKMVLDFDLSSGLHEFTVGADFEEAINAAIDVTGAINWSDQEQIAKIYLSPIVIAIPVGSLTVPLVFSPYISLSVGGSLSVQASASASAGEDFSLSGKFGWINGALQSTFDKKWSTHYQPPYFDQASAQIKFTVGAQAGIELYASPGVSMGADGYVALGASTSARPCFKLSVGIEGETNADAKILGFQIAKEHKTWNIVDLPLLTGSCDSPTGGVAQTAEAAGTLWGYREQTSDDLGAVLHVSKTWDGGVLFGRERNADSYIAKLDGTGAVQWAKAQEDTGALGVLLMRPAALLERPDTTISVLYGGPYPDQLLVLLDADANPLSVTKYSFPTDFGVSLRDFVPTNEWGTVMIGNGTLVGASSVSDQAAILRVDALGKLLWAKTLAGPDSGTSVYLASVARSRSDDTIVVSGYETGYSGDTSSRLWVAKFDLEGKLLWSNVYHSVVNDIAQHTSGNVAIAPDGSIYVGGSFERTVSSGIDDAPYLMKLDASGNRIWVNGTTDSAWVNGVTATSDGGAVLSGQTPSGYAATTQALWRARFSADGTLAWDKSYDPSPLLGRFDQTFEMAAGNLMSLGTRVDSTPTNEILLMTTVDDGTISFPADSGMTLSNLSGNAVDFSQGREPFSPAVTDLAVQVSDVPLRTSDGRAIPVFKDVGLADRQY